MEQGQDQQAVVGRRELEGGGDHRHHRRQVGVVEHHALRSAGGTAGVDEQGEGGRVGGGLVDRGAKAVYAAVTHGLLAGPANRRIDDSPIERLFITDSVETQPDPLSSKVEVVSVAGLFGEAIRRIAARESISVLFR